MAGDDNEGAYTLRAAGSNVWHIPGADRRPLCGVVLVGQLERRYLPARMDPNDITCPECLVLWRGRAGAYESV